LGFNPVWRLHGPWRRPDLGRFAQTASFRELRSAAAGWIDLQFADLEAEAAGLVRADRSVSDYGTIFGTSYRREIRLLANLRWCLGPAAWVRYQRQVAVAYGFDSPLPDQILDVVRILERAGWQPHLQTSRGGVDLTPIRSVPPGGGAALAPWEPPPGHSGGPPQLVLGRPGEATTALCQASVVWAARRAQSAHPGPHPPGSPATYRWADDGVPAAGIQRGAAAGRRQRVRRRRPRAAPARGGGADRAGVLREPDDKHPPAPAAQTPPAAVLLVRQVLVAPRSGVRA
jgi:hypothetical protein